MVSKTGWTSVGELEMTRRISPVAVCCSSASVSSRFRASSSVNRRTFSMAMTAWSAKVCEQRDLLVGEGPPVSLRRRRSRRSALPSRSIGTASTVRKPPCRKCRGARTPGSSAMSRSCTTLAGRGSRAPWRRPGPGGVGQTLATASRPLRASGRDDATRWIKLPVEPDTRRRRPPRRAARALRDDGVEDRLDVGRRARDDPQDLAGRRLLLQRLGQLAVPRLELLEQPDVLDGDDAPGRRRSGGARSASR